MHPWPQHPDQAAPEQWWQWVPACLERWHWMFCPGSCHHGLHCCPCSPHSLLQILSLLLCLHGQYQWQCVLIVTHYHFSSVALSRCLPQSSSPLDCWPTLLAGAPGGWQSCVVQSLMPSSWAPVSWGEPTGWRWLAQWPPSWPPHSRSLLTRAPRAARPSTGDKMETSSSVFHDLYQSRVLALYQHSTTTDWRYQHFWTSQTYKISSWQSYPAKKTNSLQSQLFIDTNVNLNQSCELTAFHNSFFSNANIQAYITKNSPFIQNIL